MNERILEREPGDPRKPEMSPVLKLALPGCVGAVVGVTVLSNVDGDTLGAFVISGPSSGVLVLNGDGTFEFTPDPAQAGDVILIKGSNGSRMQPLVEALQKQYAGPSTGS